MRPLPDDTIFAAASGFGRAAVSVIRISGLQAGAILESLAGGIPQPRRLTLRTLRDPETGEPLDQALVAWMPAPHSFTGEDQAEFHIHGGTAVRAAVLRAIGSVSGCRPAEAGEFTRRAFLNGRLDLTRVEGLADLIDAETEAQRRQALRQLDGELGSAVETWREELLQVLALVEAALDFSDEGDVPEALEDEASRRVRSLSAEIDAVLSRPTGERLREGFTVVLAGAPNAGKSTLLNALARREVAIVSPVAGTTRDIIEVRCDLGGLPVTLVDTAGLRDSEDPVEQEGVARARARAAAADLVLWLVAPDAPVTGPSVTGQSLPGQSLPGQSPPGQSAPGLRVATKSDLGPPPAPVDVAVSARTGAGLDALLERLRAAAERSLGGGDALLTRDRHRRALARAAEALARADSLMTQRADLELAAEEIRLATRAVGEITGRVDVEDVLDRLFGAFCIGK